MNGRQRLRMALNHQQPDRPPLDLGATPTTGAHVSVIHELRQALGLSIEGDNRVKVKEPFQMLAEVAPDLIDAAGIDCIGLGVDRTMFGWRGEGWKPWVTFQGTPVLVPHEFNVEVDEQGRLYQWPQGDRSVKPSGVMPAGGYYHDCIVRQAPIDDDALNVEDNLEEFTRISDEDLEHLRKTAEELYSNTPYGIVGNFGGTAFGDIALVPATQLKAPKGIRDVAEWYMSTVTRRDYIYEVFDRQCEIGLRNLELIFEAVGNRIDAIFVTGTDFGTQNGPFISPDAYRGLYKPFHKKVNDWIHAHTTWKTFIHSCGSVNAFIPDFIDAGFDILNPVQVTAVDMDPRMLKEKYGEQIVFWGGAANTQTTLAFGTPEEAAQQARERIEIFGRGGGFVFNTIHNIQCNTPVENVVAMLKEAVRIPAEK